MAAVHSQVTNAYTTNTAAGRARNRLSQEVELGTLSPTDISANDAQIAVAGNEVSISLLFYFI